MTQSLRSAISGFAGPFLGAVLQITYFAAVDFLVPISFIWVYKQRLTELQKQALVKILKEAKPNTQADLVKLFMDQKIKYKNRHKEGKSMVVRTNDGHHMGQDLEVEDGWLFVDNEQNPKDKKFMFGDMDF